MNHLPLATKFYKTQFVFLSKNVGKYFIFATISRSRQRQTDTGNIDTISKFTAGIAHTPGHLFPEIYIGGNDTGGKFATSVNNAGGKFSANVNSTRT
jgi:hypothetical protein